MPFDNGVAMIGNSLGKFRELPFLSDRNFYEYATLIVDPGAIDAELEKFGEAPFGRGAHYWFTRRIKELDTWVGDGHNLILLIAAPIYWEFEFTDEDGLPFSEVLSFYEMPALANLEFRRTTGNQVDYVGPANAASLFQPFLKQLSYQAITSGAGAIQPLLQVRRRTPGERQLVGCVDFYNKGRIICVPVLEGKALCGAVENTGNLLSIRRNVQRTDGNRHV